MVVLPRRYREYSASVGNQLADLGRGARGGIFPPLITGSTSQEKLSWGQTQTQFFITLS